MTHYPQHQDMQESINRCAALGVEFNRIPLFTISRNALTNKQAMKSVFYKPRQIITDNELYDMFSARLLEQIYSFPVLASFLDMIGDATDGEFYLFGGTLRRTLLSSEAKCDLDIMVPNGDNRVFDHLESCGIPHILNRRGHRRYFWKRFQFDINQPQEWNEGFKDVTDALTFFDLRINSLAYFAGTGRVVDPYEMVVSRSYCDPSINWPRWKSMPPLEVAILCIRLLRILEESPQLRLKMDDSLALCNEIIPIASSADWSAISERFPSGREKFLVAFESIITSRTT